MLSRAAPGGATPGGTARGSATQGEAAPGGAREALPPRALFVVGMPRSGTTLLTRLLDGHPQLYVLPHETHATHLVGAADPVAAFLEESLYEREYPPGSAERQRFEQLVRSSLAGRSDLRSILLALAGAVVRMAPPAVPAEAWVEKTPRHVRNVPTLLAAFGPATRCIGLVRDPRAVLASRRERFGRGSRHHVRHFARRWATVDALNHLYLRRHPREFMTVTYEGLVADVQGTMRRVAQHLQIAWDEVLTRPTADGGAWRANSSFRTPPTAAATRVNTDSLERWRSELSAGERALAEALLERRMQAWGYRPDEPVRQRHALQRALVEGAASLHLWSHRREWKRSRG